MDRRRFLKDAAQAAMGLEIAESLLGNEVATGSEDSHVVQASDQKGQTSRANSQDGVPGTPVVALEGQWSLAIDPQNLGRAHRWFASDLPGATPGRVPGIIQEAFPAYHGVAWYCREFVVPIHPHNLGRYLLHFEAVDYLADVWVNGIPVGAHEGGETPFVLDATEAIKSNGTNLLTVRVLNPTNEPIDGIVLKQTPHRNKAIPYYNGATYNCGGIIGLVRLILVPAVRVDDLFSRPDWKTGTIKLQATLCNASGKATRGHLQFTVAPATTGEALASVVHDADLPIGDTLINAEVRIDSPHLWDLEHPYLYRVTARLQADGIHGTHEGSVRCGFRDFRVVNGYFRLNGKRVFLRSTHTGNVSPIGQVLPPDSAADLLRKDMLYAKAVGFNSVRFIGVAYPYQLDLCDEIGLMVEEETYAGWLLEDSPKMKERTDRSTREMILRDRNHPSVTMWQMLNETSDGPIFRHAVKSLRLVRSLDETRLVLLSSGRFDGDLSIGTVSNPGSSEWEHEWGKEAVGASRTSNWTAGGYPSVPGVGDFHFYPTVPQAQKTQQFVRTLGHDSKPVFLSEYGIGSLMDVIHAAGMYEQAVARPNLEDLELMRSMADGLIADWKRFGLEGVYPFPEDMLRDSQRLMARHRLLGFNLVRSNPQLCGFNVTGMLDHGMTGEGIWRLWRDWKPGAMDVMQDGWWPLRWCLFVEPPHTYAGRQFKVEAVLANEDVLRPGDYPAQFRICGPSGIAWERRTTVHLPQPLAGRDALLAVPVLSEEATLSGLAGVYQLVANLEQGGAPLGRSWQFNVSNAESLPKLDQVVTEWGIEDNKVKNWLKGHGVICEPFGGTEPSRREIIVVGDFSKAGSDASGWKELARRMARGSVVVFLSPAAFRREKDPVGWLPLAKKGRYYRFTDHLYHKECVAKAHPIFEGLQAKGILDWYYYDQVIPHELFDGQDTPNDVVAAAFAVGYGVPDIAPGYAAGILMGVYEFGEGKFVLNTFPLLENLDRQPAADRLLLNLINYAAGFVRKPLADLPLSFDAKLQAIGYRQ